MSDSLRSCLAEMQAACATLADAANGTLNERQVERVREIRVCLLDLEDTISLYETPTRHNGTDPRIRLIYAARTRLAMVEMATRLLLVAHLRQNEPLKPEQHLSVRLIEAAARRLHHETERL